MASVGAVLDECYRSSTGRRGRTAKSLAKLLAAKPEQVQEDLLATVRRCLVVSKREPAVERVISGIVAFAVYKGQQPFLDALFEHLVQYSTAKDKGVRLKCCSMLRQALAGMADDAEMSDDTWYQLLDALMARSKDKNPAVRAEAAAALDRLQTGEDDCPAMARLLEMMQADTSADARKAATGTIQVTHGTLEPLLRRARDESEAVRAVAVGVLGSKAAPSAIDQTDRTRMLLDTLADPAPSVRSAGRALALRWLAACDHSLAKLAALAGDVTDPESERAASFAVAACMEAAARGSPPAEAKAARVSSAGAAPIRSIWKQAKAAVKAYRPPAVGGPSSGAGGDDGAGKSPLVVQPTDAIVWRVRCDWLAGRGGRARDDLESCLPTLTTLALAIKQTVDAGAELATAVAADGYEQEDDDGLGDFAQEMPRECSFVLRQLLALCAHADWGDEAGRSRVEQVLVDSVLARPGVPDGALFGVTGALLLSMGSDHEKHASRVLQVAEELHDAARAELRMAGGAAGAPEDVSENCALAVLRALRIVSALLGGTQAGTDSISSALGKAMQEIVCPAVASPYPAVRGAAVRCLAADAVLRLGACTWPAGGLPATSSVGAAWADQDQDQAAAPSSSTSSGPDGSLTQPQQAALEAAATALEVSCRGIAREEDECRLEAARGALDIVCALPLSLSLASGPGAGAGTRGAAQGLRSRCATAGRRAVTALIRVVLEHVSRPAHLRAQRAGEDGAWRVRLRASIAEGLSRAVLSGRLSPTLDDQAPGAGEQQEKRQDYTMGLDTRAVRALLRLYCQDDSIGAEAAADSCSEQAATAFDTIEDPDEAAEVATEGARDAELCLAADARMRQVVGSSLPTIAEMGPRCRAVVAKGASEALRWIMDASRRDAACLLAAEELGGADPGQLSKARSTKVEVAARSADPGDREVALAETAMSLVAFLASAGGKGEEKGKGSVEPPQLPAGASGSADGALLLPSIGYDSTAAGTPAEQVAASLLVEALADPKGPFAVPIARSLAKLQASTPSDAAVVAGPLALLANEALDSCERAAAASLTKFRDGALAVASAAAGETGGEDAERAKKAKGKGRGRGRKAAASASDAASACDELEEDEAVCEAAELLRGRVAARAEEIRGVGKVAAGLVLGTIDEADVMGADMGDVQEGEEEDDEAAVQTSASGEAAGLATAAADGAGLDESQWEIEGVVEEEDEDEEASRGHGEGGGHGGGGRRSMMSLSPDGLEGLAEEAAGSRRSGGGSRGSSRRGTIRGSAAGSDLRSAMEAAVEDVRSEVAGGEQDTEADFEEEGDAKAGRGRGRRGASRTKSSRGRAALESVEAEENTRGGRRTRRRRGVVAAADEDEE